MTLKLSRTNVTDRLTEPVTLRMQLMMLVKSVMPRCVGRGFTKKSCEEPKNGVADQLAVRVADVPFRCPD